MLFHAQSFVLLFLPVTVGLYYALAHSVRAREWAVIAASLVFYGWWDVRFLPLLIGHVGVSWLLARAYCRLGRRSILYVAIAANLASLAFFKYANFLADIAADLSGFALPRNDIILPIGISFFTFQIVSYLIDLERGEAPQYPLRRFALFIMLFPHLIAGPIVRHNEIIPQFDLSPLRPGLAERLSRGLTLFTIGFLLKVMVADKLAPHVDGIFAGAAGTAPPLADAWAGAIGFALQIYFDFAAYSEMAIGIALMLGLTFPLNFDMPYRSTSIREFWRRWHMTLSRFLRDYLYIPLGGSRLGTARFVFATVITMGLCGLWHGAGWTFVTWGLLHGAALIACRAWSDARLPMPAGLGWLLTVLFVTAAFVIFRSPDVTTTLNVLTGMLGASGMGEGVESAFLVLLVIGGMLSLLPLPNPVLVERYLKPHPLPAAVTALAAAYLVLEVGRGQPVSFIYFQF
jgi:D-alanyl-lipoteichoic acid acyltransferase DltB (MBOAT superfamily)